jgi:hypothetical protein
VREKQNPSAGGMARGLIGNKSNASPKPTSRTVTPQAARLWAACQQQRDAEAERKKSIATRVRAVARKLGARPAGKRRWTLTCPHCGRVNIIAEGNSRGQVTIDGNIECNCPSTHEIGRLLRAALEGGAP